MKIVFMGTPEFAVATLDAILQNGYDVVCVVTTPDKPAGRGQQLHFSDVKKYALEHNLPLLQPVSLKDDSFIEDLRDYNADVFVVVAFRMLPKAVYQMPPLGAFNVHASLLPQYRGAAPIQRAVMNGETKTGVTTFLLDEHTDTGSVLGQVEVDILDTDNAGSLHDKLMIAGANLAVETLKSLENGTAKPKPQPKSDILIGAPKIFKDDMHINWNSPAETVRNHIRGLSPYPAAFSLLGLKNNPESKRTVKIFDVDIADKKSSKKPGYITIIDSKTMLISTNDNDLSVKTLQIEGKKRMNVEDFLLGFREDIYTEFLF